MATNRSSMGRGRNSNGKGKLIGFSVVLLLAAGAAAGGGYWYLHRNAKPVESLPLAAVDNNSTAAAPTPSPAMGAPAVAPVAAPAAEPVATPTPVAPVPAPAVATPAPTSPTPVAPVHSGTPFVPVAAPAALVAQEGNVQKELAQGVALLEAGKVVEGRAILSEVLFNYTKELKPENAAWIRAKLTEINETYTYGKRNLAGDDITAIHVVKSGDVVERIANTYRVPSGLLLKISGMQSAKSLQVGQKLKSIMGPVNARVTKHEFRMDLYTKNANGAKIYLKSLPVGLGAENKTPTGLFRIGSIENGVLRGKMPNPSWIDPDTRKRYEGGAPDNPIGKFWIPLQGMEPANANFLGYGVHGTSDQDSIGQNKSQGCVRLREADIEELYHTLFCGKTIFSTLEILP